VRFEPGTDFGLGASLLGVNGGDPPQPSDRRQDGSLPEGRPPGCEEITEINLIFINVVYKNIINIFNYKLFITNWNPLGSSVG
jgi:hypothetical protein